MLVTPPDTTPCALSAPPRVDRVAGLLALVATFTLGTTAEALQEAGDAAVEAPVVEDPPGASDHARNDEVETVPHDPTGTVPMVETVEAVEAVEAPPQVPRTIQSEPSSALIAVEGVKVGTTPPEPFAAPLDPKYRRRSRIAAGSLLGSSVALVAAGATLVALDDEPIRERCRGHADPRLDCSHRYETEAAGATLLAAGLGASVAAVVVAMVFNQRVHNHRSRFALLQPTWAGLGLAF